MSSPTNNSTSPPQPSLLEILSFIDHACPAWPFYVWVLGTVLFRFGMIEKGLDGHGAGVFDKVIETFSKWSWEQDPQWAKLLKRTAPHNIISFGRASVTRKSVQRHSWLWFEYLVDCVTPKEHISFEDPSAAESGSWLPWRHRHLRGMSKVGGFQFEQFRTFNGLGDQSDTSDVKFQHKPGPKSVEDFEIILIYGPSSVNIRGGAEIEQDYRWTRDKKALCAFLCFGLFDAGLTHLNMIAAIIFLVVTATMVFLIWIVGRSPRVGRLAFYTAIAEQADRIHEAGLDRMAKTGQGRRETIDVLLYGGDSITWCRIGNSWISVALPIEKPFWDYSLEVVLFLAYTIMPGGWFNEKNIIQNLGFALITVFCDWLLPWYLRIFGIGTWFAAAAHIFHLKEAKNGHYWILSWYVWIGGLLFGPREEFGLAKTELLIAWDKTLQVFQKKLF